MRILFLSSIFPHATARVTGTFNWELCRALATEHDVRVVAPRSFLDWGQALRKFGIGQGQFRISEVPDPGRLNPGRLAVSYPTYFYTPGFARSLYGELMWWSVRRHLQRVVEQFRPEAVVSYWVHPDGEVALRTAQPLGIPSVVIVGGSDVLQLPNDQRRRPKIQRVLRESSAVMTVSEGLRQAVIDLGTDPSRVHTIYQGVDAELFHPGEAPAARQRLSLPNDRRLLLWVGRMVAVKGLDTLISAFDLARQRQSDLHLLLVGDGPLRASLQADVLRRGLSDHVTFAGAQSPAQLPDWYRAADLFVLSSLSEGLPNVLREAVACGRPFVSTDVGSVREIAQSHAGSPFAELVPVGDAVAMSRAIERVLRPEYVAVASSVPCRSWRETAHELAWLLSSLRGEATSERADTVPHEMTV